MPIAPIRRFRAVRLDPVMDPDKASEIPVNLVASIEYAAGTVLGELIGTDEEVTITIDATGGTFTVTFGAQTTGPVAWNATAAVMQAALELLSTIGPGNIMVLKSGLVFRLIFRDELGSQNVGAVTTTVAGLTGGAGTAVVAVAVAGVAGTPGTYGKYASGNTDGSQNPKGVLRYPCFTDADGNITIGFSEDGGEWGQTVHSVDMFVNGVFRTEDLVGLDTNAVTKLGRLIFGTVAHGRISIFGA